MRAKSLLGAGALMLGLSSNAWGIYLTGYTDWQSLSVVEKSTYVAGTVDYLTGLAAPNEPFRWAFSGAMMRCLVDGKTKTTDLANDVDRLYGDYVELRKTAPATVVYLGLVRRCEETLNQYMTAAGQQSLSFSAILHNLSAPP
jgi:hypothetical protein